MCCSPSPSETSISIVVVVVVVFVYFRIHHEDLSDEELLDDLEEEVYIPTPHTLEYTHTHTHTHTSHTQGSDGEEEERDERDREQVREGLAGSRAATPDSLDACLGLYESQSWRMEVYTYHCSTLSVLLLL